MALRLVGMKLPDGTKVRLNLNSICYVEQRDRDAVVHLLNGLKILWPGTSADELADSFEKMSRKMERE
jgi:ferric-dicitrate binding protein FerR (iron transport regulator)